MSLNGYDEAKERRMGQAAETILGPDPSLWTIKMSLISITTLGREYVMRYTDEIPF